jgi:hypothetical protein
MKTYLHTSILIISDQFVIDQNLIFFIDYCSYSYSFYFSEFMSRSSGNVDAIRASMVTEEEQTQTVTHTGTGTHTGTHTGTGTGTGTQQGVWQASIVEDVTGAYLQQVQSLVETARQMDSVFMKRSKGVASAAAASKSTLSDSEKIALQMIFDINAFEQEIKNVGIPDPSVVSSFVGLHGQIAEMKILFQNLANMDK